jgi:hypothetical protein
VIPRRSRFRDLVEKQLDLLLDDEHELVTEAAEAEQAWTRAAKENAEEAYGDFQLVVDAISDLLLETRDTYARTLEEPVAEEYGACFNKEAAKRFRRYGTIASDLEV